MSPSRREPEPEEELYYEELDSGMYEAVPPAQSSLNTWLRWLFWAGTALAPIAAVLLVMGQGVNPLRAAATLAILGVVCIGFSVTLRDNSSAAHAELAEDLQHEVEQVRAELETLRRGVQLTVNRELGRVRGELEAAQQVLRTEATRLPAHSVPPAAVVSQPVGVATPATPRAARRSTREVPPFAAPARGAAVAPRVARLADRSESDGAPAVEEFNWAHDAARGAINGTPARTRVPGYDPLASTASHPIVTAAAARRELVDPQTVEPIRQKYSRATVPEPRSSFSDYLATAAPAVPQLSSQASRWSSNDYGDEVVSGDVLPPESTSYGDSGKWSWASSTSTQDWTPDFDLPSLDGLPIPGYAAAASSSSAQRARGRHSADNGSDAA
ncbi:MAG: hypothetical protein ACR2JX_10040 [Mycobacteriales bacterium]